MSEMHEREFKREELTDNKKCEEDATYIDLCGRRAGLQTMRG